MSELANAVLISVSGLMDHLADLDLTAFAQAMSGIAAPEIGPPVRHLPTSPA